LRLQDRLTEAWERQAGDDQRVERRLVALAVARYLEQLDSQVRQVVVLRYFVDLSVREIAAELDIPEGTVKEPHPWCDEEVASGSELTGGVVA